MKTQSHTIFAAGKMPIWMLFLCASLNTLISCSTESTPVYTLNADASPAEAGTVTPGQGEYDEGAEVQVNASANEHWVFTGWGEDHSGSDNPSTVLMDSDKAISALFEKKEYTLMVNIEGEGKVEEQLVNAKTTDYPAESVVELTAIPEEGWVFLEWGAAISGSMNPQRLTLNESEEVTAYFEKEEAKLLDIVFTVKETDYATEITGSQITTKDEVPYGITGEMSVKSILLSQNANSNISEGQSFDIENPPVVVITSQSGQKQNTYEIIIKKDEDAELLFNDYSQKACDAFEIILFEDLMLENNLWNSENLDEGAYSQCVYLYANQSNSLYGWHWSFPENSEWVNAYPEIIYGWKPWYYWRETSTTEDLPKKVSEIDVLKIHYEAKVHRNEGAYNLAFDNWITSSSEILPENITFELMVWEDANLLVPFGDYQGNFETSNGTYELYIGEPDWEPEGTNWTYIAFNRTNYRNKGMVDLDEIINYLLEKGIIPEDSYLADVELGNEVGKSSEGYTIIKEFNVQVE